VQFYFATHQFRRQIEIYYKPRSKVVNALGDLTNPGGDLTYPLQFVAGALINTGGSSNGFWGGING